MEKINVNIVNNSINELPKYALEGDAGMDLRAWVGSKDHCFIQGTSVATDKDKKKVIRIMPGGRCKIDTGIHISLPEGFEAQIRPRSGMSLKTGLMVIIGTVDSNYRGSIGIILVNLGTDVITINEGDRIAQMVINQVGIANLIEVNTLDDTNRGESGFGGSGIK